MSVQIVNVRDNTNWAILAGMRFALAWIVTCAHVDEYFFDAPTAVHAMSYLGGKAAVVGFFLISGYSIAASIQRYPTGFYRRRLVRVYPVYFVAITAAFILERSLPHGLVVPHGDAFHASGPVVALGNAFFLQTFLVKPMAFNVPVWSLAIEMSYYFVAPLLSRLPRWGFMAIIAVSAVSYACPRSSEYGNAYFLFTHFNMLTYAWAWFMGYYLFIHRTNMVILAFGVVGSILIYLNTYLNPEIYAIQTYIVEFVMIVLAIRSVTPIRNVLVKRLLNFLGNVSYPLYLMQFPIILAAYAFWGTQNVVILLGLCLLGGTAAFYLIDVYGKLGVTTLIAMGRARFGNATDPGRLGAPVEVNEARSPGTI